MENPDESKKDPDQFNILHIIVIILAIISSYIISHIFSSSEGSKYIFQFITPENLIFFILTSILLYLSYKLIIWLFQTFRIKQNTKSTMGEVISYRLDYYFSTVPFSMPYMLISFVLFFTALGGVIFHLVNSQDQLTLGQSLFTTWTFLIDTAAHTGYDSLLERIVGLVMTILGLVVVGFLIGMISEIIGAQMDALKKGRSRVIETNHTLILGWSDKTLPIINEISNANESEGGGTIVIMSQREKLDMELDINISTIQLRGSIVICRSGNPCLTSDLQKVSAQTTRSIIILANQDVSADESDAHVLRVILALTALDQLQGHVVAEYSDIDNKELATLAGQSSVEVMVAHDIIGRIMLQCSRMPGLATVLDSLLGFEGSEFYMENWAEMEGISFKTAAYYFPDAILLGYCNDENKHVLNPPDEYVIQKDDRLIVIAEDNDTYKPLIPTQEMLNKLLSNTFDNLPKVDNLKSVPERLLFVGWRRDLDDMIMELEKIVVEGTVLWLFSEVPIAERLRAMEDGGLDVKSLKNLTLHHMQGNPVSRRHLERLPIETFDSILILADEKLEGNPTTMDSIAIASLLLIRDIAGQRLKLKSNVEISSLSPKRTQLSLLDKKKEKYRSGYSSRIICDRNSPLARPTITSEILDSHTKAILAVANISDFVASNELVSKAIAMVSESREVNNILQELLSDDANETYLHDAISYAQPGENLCFYEIMARARLRKEIAFGYQNGETGELLLNPANKTVERKWIPDDVIIVISEENMDEI